MDWKTICPIWGQGHAATIHGEALNAKGEKFIAEMALVDSPRTDGQYYLYEEADRLISSRRLPDGNLRARLTTWLVDQRRQGNIAPSVTGEIARSFIGTNDRRSLPMAKRAERLLRFLISRTNHAGETVVIHECFDSALAWSESVGIDEVLFLLAYLNGQEFIQNFDHLRMNSERCIATVSVKGYAYLEELITNPDSSQAFVAMWFDKSMNDAYENGLAKGIRDAGFTPLRIDRKEDVIKIDDEIIAEIRRSRFVVADMTHGKKGARGGVYFEAGFALGLDLPVIYCCRDDDISELHFDTQQYHHIFWKTPEELRVNLRNRIRAIVGEGPELSRTAL